MSFSYPPNGMSEKEFVNLKINWLIENDKRNLIEKFLKQNENLHHDAIDFFSQAIAINEKCDVAYYGRAQSFLQNGLIDKAIADLKQTIEIQPFAPHAYYKLAHAYADTNNLEKSKQIIQRLLTFEPQVGNQLKKELKLET